MERPKSALYIGFTAIGVLGGLFARDAIDINKESIASPNTPITRSYDPEQPIYEATIAADIHKKLFPSPTVTNTPYPTATGTADPANDRSFCRDDSKEGDVCKVPHPPPPTPTPYPDCTSTDLSPGDWCIVKGGE